MEAAAATELTEAANRFAIITPDGQPLRWALNWLYGARLRRNVRGSELMWRLCERSAAEGVPIYLYGATRQTLATLQLDPDLVAQADVRDRVAAAVAAVRAANPSGVLRTTELVYDARRAWLVVATLPKPTLADLLDAVATLPLGAGSAVAVDTAAALRELHASGLSHGDVNAG